MIRTKGWWDKFWGDKNNQYGPPNKSVLGYAKQFITERTNNLTAVDIASGNGRYAVELAKMGYKVDAIEYADSGVKRILAAAKSAGLDVDASQGDFTRLCKVKRQYDLVFCSGLLEEIDKKHHKDVILGFMEWTRPGGIDIIKYCLEIRGRGRLVDGDSVNKFYEKAGWDIILFHEKERLHKSKAKIDFTGDIDSGIRTGTLVAIKPAKTSP